MRIEDIKIVYIPDEKTGTELLRQVAHAKEVSKRMEEYQQVIENWVKKVDGHIKAVEDTFDLMEERRREDNTKLVETLDKIEKELSLLSNRFDAHLQWHEENKSFLKKLFK